MATPAKLRFSAASMELDKGVFPLNLSGRERTVSLQQVGYPLTGGMQ